MQSEASESDKVICCRFAVCWKGGSKELFHWDYPFWVLITIGYRDVGGQNAWLLVMERPGLTYNPFNAEFLKWTCPTFHLEESMVNFRNIKIKMVRNMSSHRVEPGVRVQMYQLIRLYAHGIYFKIMCSSSQWDIESNLCLKTTHGKWTNWSLFTVCLEL